MAAATTLFAFSTTALKVITLAGLAFVIAVNMYKGRGTVLVKSTLDGQSYKVLPRADNLEAANMLATVNANLTKLIKHMYAKFPKDKDVSTLYDRYKGDALQEARYDIGNTSFSINKGQAIHLCIRQSNGQLVDMNTLMYVAIHEMAHVMTPSIGHDNSFWENMQRLVKHAAEIKLYDYMDYSKKPTKYCGISITSSV
jgi:hypothetical protein